LSPLKKSQLESQLGNMVIVSWSGKLVQNSSPNT
jgi:hypothetical protein